MAAEEWMREFIANPAFARNAQIVLIIGYVLLAALFFLHKKTWPVAFYYVGCFVKDTGVLALAFFMRWFR